MYNNIEFVCSGNNDRSPVSQAIAMHVVKSLGLESKVQVCSSGINADFSKAENLYELILPYLRRNVENGIFPAEYLERAKSNPEEVLDKMMDTFGGWRNKFIMDKTGYDFSGHKRKQTIVRPEAKLILPVDEKVLKKVNELYSGRSDVKIELMPVFAGIDANFGEGDLTIRGYDDYKSFMDTVEVVARKATEKAIRC